ncbi:MAG TPA: penicillin-binding transpeptidase domain-containing protein [Microbacteriaceae bacterium]
MSKSIRRLTSFILIMFLTLFAFATGIQVFQADSLVSDGRNVRVSYDSYKTLRGTILVESNPIASSFEVDDNFRYQREYQSEVYSHLTGYFSLFQGSTGIEREMSNFLSGQSSAQFFDQINAVLSGTPISGANVELTIDDDLQQAAWDALGNNKGSVIAIDPKSGEIKALVSKPGFDANLLASHSFSSSSSAYEELLTDPDDPLINRSISGDQYHPGSVFKLVVAAAAFESGRFDPDTEFDNPDFLRLPGSFSRVQNANDSTCGEGETVTLRTAFVKSCNIPFAELGMQLGADELRVQSELFGFGRDVDIPMPVSRSIFPEELNEAQTALVSFGQYDLRSTPMQMAMVTSAIANQGIIYSPQLIDRVVSNNLELLSDPEPQVFGSPISQSTAGLLTQMMFESVEVGAAGNAKIPGMAVAGKTGTAENGLGQPYTYWFTGFAPAENPELVVTVVVEGVDQLATGNSMAAPIGRKLLESVR